MSYIPKYILKRMFPKDKCFRLMSKSGGEATQVRLTMVNVMGAISIPDKIDIGGLTTEDLAKGITIKLNGTAINVTKELIETGVTIIHSGVEYDWNALFVEHKAAGITVAIGDKLAMNITLDDQMKSLLKPGSIEIDVTVEVGGTTKVTHTVDLPAEVVPWTLEI